MSTRGGSGGRSSSTSRAALSRSPQWEIVHHQHQGPGLPQAGQQLPQGAEGAAAQLLVVTDGQPRAGFGHRPNLLEHGEELGQGVDMAGQEDLDFRTRQVAQDLGEGARLGCRRP